MCCQSILLSPDNLRKLARRIIVASISVKLSLHVMKLNLNYKQVVNGIVINREFDSDRRA